MKQLKLKKKPARVTSFIAFGIFLLLIIPCMLLCDLLNYIPIIARFLSFSLFLPLFLAPFLSFILASIVLWRPLYNFSIQTQGLLLCMVGVVITLYITTPAAVYFLLGFEKEIEFNTSVIICSHQPLVVEELDSKYQTPKSTSYPHYGNFIERHINDAAYFCTAKEANTYGYTSF